jgi:hypothetical protein
MQNHKVFYQRYPFKMSHYRNLPHHSMSDEDWTELAAANAVDELIAGKIVEPEKAEFALRIVAQQLFVLLVSNCRPVPMEAPKSK